MTQQSTLEKFFLLSSWLSNLGYIIVNFQVQEPEGSDTSEISYALTKITKSEITNFAWNNR